jgi:hypothetical protein
MAGENDEIDYDGMSDEEFLNATFTADDKAEEIDNDWEDEPRGGILEDMLDAAPAQTEASDEADEDDQSEAKQAEGGDKPTDEPVKAEDGDDKDPDHTTPHQSTDDTAEEKDPAGESEGEESAKADGETDYKALYEQLMRPFKANGKEFKPASPEEAMQLMQMGANYTKKMQSLKPNLRMMRMLDNHGLLDESKISFLIDLNRKDPKAIQKLLHEGKIDPLEIDTSTEPAYTPGNHSVSDQELAFHDVIQDVGSTDDGKKTISHVNTHWDHASKQAIFAEPAILAHINEQRSNGIYDVISAEIERQKTLGNLQNVPFIQAYRDVGNRLHAEGKFGPVPGSTAPATPENTKTDLKARQVVDTRPAQPRKQISNGDKARAASASPKTSQTRKTNFDPLAMSDEEIMAIPVPHAL